MSLPSSKIHARDPWVRFDGSDHAAAMAARSARLRPNAIERRSGSLCEIARQQAAGLTALTVGSISIGLLTNPAAGLCGTGYDAQHRARPTIC